MLYMDLGEGLVGGFSANQALTQEPQSSVILSETK